MKSKFKATHKIITPQLNKQKSQKNSPLCTVYSPLCTQCTPNKVKNISNNVNIVIWNNIEGHQTQFRFFEQNLFFWQKKNLSNQWRINLIRMISQRPSPLHRCDQIHVQSTLKTETLLQTQLLFLSNLFKKQPAFNLFMFSII